LTGRAGQVVLAAVLMCLLAATPVSLARFTASKTAPASFQALTIAPPTSLAGVNGTNATLGWTPSVTASATGYYVLRSATPGSGYGTVANVTPASATSTTDNPGVGTWYYVLQAYRSSWTSASSNQATVVVSPAGTGYKGCAANAPEVTGSGDNNGYETAPANACARDAAVAQDAGSGTSTVNSCTDTGKDRHRFWGYSFGLPASVTAITGITIQAVAGENSTSGTAVLCAQVSGDGGATWTAAKQVTITATALTAYTLGGSADDWGHGAWSPSQLGTSTFRVRITNVATIATRTFRLDYLGVQVWYTP
jgi:hypothetical protein